MATDLVPGVGADRVATWEASCVEELALVAGVELVDWIRQPAAKPTGSHGALSGAMVLVAAPQALRDAADSGLGDVQHPSRRTADVLLDLTADGLSDRSVRAAEVWRFGYGHGLARNPAAVVLTDYVRGRQVTRAALVSEPAGSVLRDGRLWSGFFWPGGSKTERILLDAAAWPASVARDRLARLAVGEGESALPSAPRGRATSIAERRSGPPRQVLETAAVGRRLITMATGLMRHSDWNIGLAAAPIEQMALGTVQPEITWLPIRRGCQAADPFGVERDGVLHVLFEELDARVGRGVISHLSIDADGVVSPSECVLERPFHLSYPYLVEQDGEVFMIPETAEEGRLVLYEATDFPRGWRPAVTLLDDAPAIDASVVQHEGRWWMFGSRLDRGHNHSLFVWHAPALTGPWTPHAANPVKTDAASARSGGTPFVVNGTLYRPSQDSSISYGRRVIVNRVDVLTPTAYAETPVRAVEPPAGSPYPDGLHTLAAVGARTLIDGDREHFVAASLRYKVASRLRR